ncbi:QsdR family transcriptional regulator [Nocardia alni]|uniref:QsdR family transcriptional regulator n=1 Tax=Nocardia alni TaxID=2815723 RepID=UPI0020B2E52C|nr:QsdR family transcriptional regulator [Nocardia alni]
MASPDAVLEVTLAAFRAGERVDVYAIAAGLGVSRASVYRWFGSRDGLLGAALARQLERMVQAADRRCRARGAERVSQVLDRTVRWLAEDSSLRTYFDNESTAALRLITRSDGLVHQATVAALDKLIQRAEEQDGYRPPIDRGTLAYALVRLVEAFLYNDAVAGFRGEVDRLREVQEALLGVHAQE